MRFLRFPLFVLVVLAAFGFGYGWRDMRSGDPSGGIGRLLAKQEAQPPIEVFRQNYRRIVQEFYKPVDERQLKYAGMQGLIASLGDPHSQLLEPKDAAEFSLETRGNFVGIGAKLGPSPDGARVSSVFSDGPAFKAGLRPGDTIYRVDALDVKGKAVDEIVSKIRGKEGTLVKLTIERPGAAKPKQFTIRRSLVVEPTAEGQMIPGTKIGLISISLFAEPTTMQFDRAIAQLAAKGARALVLDLRGNPGGLLETAVELLSRFASNKLAVRIRSRGGSEELAVTSSGDKLKRNYPVAILINEDSASASEIFAGVMQGYKLATLVGEHTYGKTSVQTPFPLIDGATAKITIARYDLPNGVEISRKLDEEGQYVSGGLTPDVQVPFEVNDRAAIGDPATDSQLRAAVKLLQQRLGAAA